MVKKLTEGVHLGLYKFLDMGEELDSETARKFKRYRFCQRFGWTPEEYDRQPASVIQEFVVMFNTEAKVREVKNG